MLENHRFLRFFVAIGKARVSAHSTLPAKRESVIVGYYTLKKYVMRIPRLYFHGLSSLVTDIQELDRIVLGEIVQKATVGEEQVIDGVQHQGITT